MQKLSELIRGNDLIVAPVALNPIMARLAEEAGFKAIYLSGGSLGWLKCVTEANLTLPELADVAVAAVLSSTAPLFAIPFGLIFLGERLTTRAVIGTLVTVAGVTILQL